MGERRREVKEREKRREQKRIEREEKEKRGKLGKREKEKTENEEEEEKKKGDMDVETGETKVENGEEKVENGEEKVENGEEKVETGEEKVENGETKVETGETTSNQPTSTTETVETVETIDPNAEESSHSDVSPVSPVSPVLKATETGSEEGAENDWNDLSSFSESQRAFIQQFREAVAKRDVASTRVLLRQCKQHRLCFGRKRVQYVLAIRSTVREAEELLQSNAEQERLRKEQVHSIEDSENWKPYVSPLGTDRFGHVFFLFPHDYHNLYFLSPSENQTEDRFVETSLIDETDRRNASRAFF